MSKEKITDLEGNGFLSLKAMCENKGISYSTFLRWTKEQGLSIEQALKRAERSKEKISDGFGNEFSSVKEMCAFHGINRSTFDNRVKRQGWSVEKALSANVKDPKKKIADHLGNEFPSLPELCRYYGVNEGLVKYRLQNGWSMEETLTLPSGSTRDVFDHKGRRFSNAKKMCEEYGVPYGTYMKRLKKGWTLQKILEEPVKGMRHAGFSIKNNGFSSGGIRYMECRCRKCGYSNILSFAEMEKHRDECLMKG